MNRKIISHLPNILTVFRIAITPLFIVLLLQQVFTSVVIAAGVFLVASLTDYFDGHIARHYHVESVFGAFLDPLSDKIVTGAAFISFVFLKILWVPLWLVGSIIARELFVTIMRIIALRKKSSIHTEYSGKIKTAFQMVTIIVTLGILITGLYLSGRISPGELSEGIQFWRLLCGKSLGTLLYTIPPIFVGISAILALFSMVTYIIKNKSLFGRSS